MFSPEKVKEIIEVSKTMHLFLIGVIVVLLALGHAVPAWLIFALIIA